MGRRKIEIKAIKDDRNRSVTFLKRKGGLFKKAHELSVLCSVDVAVFIFGNNKKLYEYSSSDMRDLITRYQFHGGPSEHKGPSDFNANNDEEEDGESGGTPPRSDPATQDKHSQSQMMPPQFHAQGPTFPQMRHHTPSASPPIPNGNQFTPHPAAHAVQRVHTPQPPINSRPGSRNDMRRIGPTMVAQPVGPQGAPHPGITYMPTPPIYNPPAQANIAPQANMMPQPPPQYPYQPPQNQMPQPPYVDERRSMPPAFSSQPVPQAIQAPVRPTPSPQPNHQQLPSHPIPHISPPPPQPPQIERRLQDPPPPPPVGLKTEPPERPKPLLNTDTAIKKLPQRKTHSIFTPIEENRSILSQHLASFAPEPKKELVSAPTTNNASNRSQSVDVGTVSRSNENSALLPQRSSTQTDDKQRVPPLATIPETTFTPPSRSNSLKIGGGPAGARPRGPRLTVQIPDGGSEGGTPTADSSSPRNPTETTTTTTTTITTQAPQRHNSQSSLVLPPPSPSAQTLLSAGATGPPNPFARPPPQQTVNGDTPVSALPSRFLNNEFLPSPSSFYHDWPFRGGDSNTLPSPLNFATPVVGTGPSFLRDDIPPVNTNSNLNVISNPQAKRKTPEITNGPSEPPDQTSESKRIRVE